MVYTTVRITASTRDILREMARVEGRPMQTLLEEAVETLRRKRLLEEVNAGYRPCAPMPRPGPPSRRSAGSGTTHSTMASPFTSLGADMVLAQRDGHGGSGHDRARRGDLWLVDLSPIRGHEQAGRRPALVVSEDSLQSRPGGTGDCLADHFDGAIDPLSRRRLPTGRRPEDQVRRALRGHPFDLDRSPDPEVGRRRPRHPGDGGGSPANLVAVVGGSFGKERLLARRSPAPSP